MKTGLGIVFLTFICTALCSDCPAELTAGCSCEHKMPSLANIQCSFAGQQNITQTLILNNTSNQPMKINLLNITGSNLISLPSDFLESVESINRVDFSNNLFADVPPCLQFVDTTFIDISYNQIQSVNLSELQTQGLDISQNQVSKIHINDITKQMNLLKFSNNQIVEIPQNLWMVGQSVDLSFNRIVQLPNAVSASTKNINLQGNSIQEIPDNWFLGFKDLISLDISRNQINSVTNETFSGLSSLFELQLSQNQLSDISDDVFQHTSQIQKLNLNGNTIRELKTSTFRGLEESLMELRMSKNELEVISSDTFVNLLALQHLDLSDNVKIRNVDHINFPSHLTVLNLSNTNLLQIDDCKFFRSYDLQHLDLSSNKLNCNCHLSWLYAKFESKRQAGQKMPRRQWMCRSTNGMQRVQGDLSRCPGDSFKEHHCRTVMSPIIKAEDINITFLVSAAKKGVLTTWEIEPVSVVEWLEGFKVYYISEDLNAESPILDNTKRLFDFDMVEAGSRYTVCLHLLENANTTLKKTCYDVYMESYQIIVGILAGVVFLCPCVAAMTFILLKDKKMMYELIYGDEEFCCDEHKEQSKLETEAEKMNGNRGKSLPSKPCVEARVNEVSHVQTGRARQQAETPLDVKRLNDLKVSQGRHIPNINKGYVSDNDVSRQSDGVQLKTVTKL